MNLKKQTLYDCALALLNEKKSADRIAVSQIAERAGIGKSTVYEYFTSKEELFAQAIFYYLQRQVAVIRQEVSGQNFREGFRLLIDTAIQVFQENEAMFDFLFMNRVLMEPESQLQATLQQQLQQLQMLVSGYFVELVQKGVEEGILEELPDIRDIYFAFVAVMCQLRGWKEDGHSCGPFHKMNREELTQYSYGMFIKILR